MLTSDVRVEGFTAADWEQLAHLFSAPTLTDLLEPAAPPLAARRGGLLAIVEGERLIKLVSTANGRREPSAHRGRADVPLRALAERERARWAVRFELGALDELVERFSAQLRPDDDFLEQTLSLLALARELARERKLELWPFDLARAPVPSAARVWAAVDLFCRPGAVILLGAFAAGELATCVAIRRGLRGFDAILGPDELREPMGVVSGDWTRDHRFLSEVVEERLGPLAVGAFAEVSTWQRLITRRSPGAWASAVAARDVIVAPATPLLAVPLGLDVGVAALAFGGRLAARAGLTSWFGSSSFAPLVDELRGSAWRSVQTQLGFDPLALLGALFGELEEEP